MSKVQIQLHTSSWKIWSEQQAERQKEVWDLPAVDSKARGREKKQRDLETSLNLSAHSASVSEWKREEEVVWLLNDEEAASFDPYHALQY